MDNDQMFDEEIIEAMNRILIPIINDIANNPEKYPEITQTGRPAKKLTVAMPLKNDKKMEKLED